MWLPFPWLGSHLLLPCLWLFSLQFLFPGLQGPLQTVLRDFGETLKGVEKLRGSYFAGSSQRFARGRKQAPKRHDSHKVRHRPGQCLDARNLAKTFTELSLLDLPYTSCRSPRNPSCAAFRHLFRTLFSSLLCLIHIVRRMSNCLLNTCTLPFIIL